MRNGGRAYLLDRNERGGEGRSGDCEDRNVLCRSFSIDGSRVAKHGSTGYGGGGCHWSSTDPCVGRTEGSWSVAGMSAGTGRMFWTRSFRSDPTSTGSGRSLPFSSPVVSPPTSCTVPPRRRPWGYGSRGRDSQGPGTVSPS